MTHEPSPEEAAAARLIADPDLVQRRLAADLEAVAALGRGHVRLDPSAGTETLAARVREAADRIGFESPLEAATLSKRSLVELPVAERSQHKIEAYHSTATRTLREGTVVADRLGSDHTRYVEFQHHVPETDLVSLTLAARVRVQAEGVAWLDAFGWPDEPSRPVHTFTGSPEHFLAHARADLHNEEIPLDRALLLLLGATLQGTDGLGLTEPLRVEIAEAVATRWRELNAYVSRADDYASVSGGEQWYAASLYRSGLENVFESFLGGATFDLIAPEDLDDMDEELRENLPNAQGATSGAVPPGMPSGHWWWNLAANGRPE